MKVSKGSAAITVIIGVLVLIIIGGGIWYVVSQKQLAPSTNLLTAPLVSEKIITDGYKYEFIYKQGPEGSVLNDHLVFVSPSGEKTIVPDNVWFSIDPGSAFIKTGKHAKGSEGLSSNNMPVHPLNKDIIFMSISKSLDETSSRTTSGIYSYNLKTSELKEIYSEITENDSLAEGVRIFRIIGIDGSKIIVLYDDSDNSLGPCENIWSLYKDKMKFLELADIQSGLKSYTVPEYKIEEGQIKADKCLDEL